ncbi:heme A synthase [bacterium]|nr:heme A synthase [bacterium]
MNNFNTSKLSNVWLRRFSKLTCFSTLFLIFAGGLVTSTNSGLAVPDWPLSYGMVFPPMVGGVFYEHGHRMIASAVGFFVLVLAFWLAKSESRTWVKKLGFAALGAVILQGILGGITVLFLLPTAISVSHGILAQTFFLITIFLVYSQSKEREFRTENETNLLVKKLALTLTVLVYFQLIIAAIMRHTHSGLAIPDFPLSNGNIFPAFDEAMLTSINNWRLQTSLSLNTTVNLEPVTTGQVVINFIHRFMALLITLIVGFLSFKAFKLCSQNKKIIRSVVILDCLLILQITLGAFTVWLLKHPFVTSFHVVTGAALLGMSAFLTLQVFPLSFKKRNFQ